MLFYLLSFYMQHFLYFLPLPQGQGSFLPTLVVFRFFDLNTFSFLNLNIFCPHSFLQIVYYENNLAGNAVILTANNADKMSALPGASPS